MLVFVLNQAQKANTGKIQTPVYENVREFGNPASRPKSTESALFFKEHLSVTRKKRYRRNRLLSQIFWYCLRNPECLSLGQNVAEGSFLLIFESSGAFFFSPSLKETECIHGSPKPNLGGT